MDTKGTILRYLDEKGVNDPFSNVFLENTTEVIANRLHISRTLASQYLNELHKEKRVVKIISRPVLYLSAQQLAMELHVIISDHTFEDVDIYKEWYQNVKEENDIIGFSGSLIYAISHIQTGLLYPDHGLPILLCGQNGSGKKYLIQKLIAYDQRKNRLSSKWQMKKIAMTDHGSIAALLTHVKQLLKAHDPILFYFHSFLDTTLEQTMRFVEELWKLKEQEHSFNFIIAVNDAEFNLYYPVLEERMSVVARIPSLAKRSLQERQSILIALLQREVQKLKKKSLISSKAFEILEELTHEVNISTLNRIICQSVANAYRADIEKEEICLHVEHLPNEVNSELISRILKNGRKEHSLKIMEMNVHACDFPFFTLSKKIMNLLETEDFEKENEIAYAADNIFYMLRTHIDEQLGTYYYEEMKHTVPHQIISNITMDFEDTLHVFLPPGFPYLIKEFYDLYGLSEELHTFQKIDESQAVLQMIKRMKNCYANSYAIAANYLNQLTQKLNLRFSPFMAMLITISYEIFNKGRQQNLMGALIISHGASTATSICDTANFLLGRKIFTALDMPLNMSVFDIVEKVNDYLEFNNIYSHVIILVDMGSLNEIPQYLEKHHEITYGIINNISTSVALDVGERIKNNQNFFDILDQTVKNIQFEYRIVQPQHKKKAIVVTSNLGQRTTSKIAQLFQNSIPSDNPFAIIEYDFEQLKEKREHSLVFKEYDVALLVKPDVLAIDFVPCVSLEDMMYMQDAEQVNSVLDRYMTKEQIKEFHMNLVKNFTLENVVETLTILNAKHLMDLVVESVERLTQMLNKSIDARTRIGIYMHICFLVERLVTKNEIQSDEDVSSQFSLHNAQFIHTVKKSFQNILESYCVDLPISEIMYLYNYIYEEE